MLVVPLLAKIASLYGCVYHSGLVGLFLRELSADFSREYLTQFPHVIRIVSGNEFKRKEYAQGFGNAGVEFLSYEFVEIQGTVEEIVEHKLDQVPEVANEVIVVDDTALELVALDGFPGPYVKSFFQSSCIGELDKKLTKLGDKRAYVVHTIGVKFNGYRAVQAVRFPVFWGAMASPGHDFDPYCYYKSRPLTALNGFFRYVIAFWIKVMIRRINSRSFQE